MSNEELIDRFEQFLHNRLSTKSSFHPYFERAYTQMFEAGGKRFRPLLLLSVVDSYQKELLNNAQYIALAIEMFHTYSLIHDDLPTFDDAPLRRGVKTLHKSYDEVTATLVGDALNSDSFLMIADAPLADDIKVKLIRCLSQNGGGEGMVLGQAIDCYFEKRKLSLGELEFLHIHKTAKLIAASLKMGAIIVDLDKNMQELLYEIGLKIGLLFQIQDDIIDATKSSLEAGKPTNNDTEKNSFVNLLGLEKAFKEKDRLVKELQIDLQEVEEPLKSKLLEMIDRYFK